MVCISPPHRSSRDHAAERESCHFCQLRAFPTHKDTPVSIVNAQDRAVISPDFRFINCMVLGHGVEPAEDSFRSGCSCERDVDCQFMGCLCLAELEDVGSSSADEDEHQKDESHAANGHRKGKKKAYAYHSHGDKKGLLRSKMLDSKEPLYECHAGCSCSKDCPNRVVERGKTIPLQIFRTPDRGWGVHAQVAIKKGQFVDRYLGEIITSAEADRRRAASAISQRKDVYLFALDKFTNPESLDPRLKGPPLEVDGEFLSGPTRFINHSCDPNLRIFARVGDHADKHMHDLALFAIREIAAGEELTFDYVDGVTDDGGEAEMGNGAHMTPCFSHLSSSPPSPVALTLRRHRRDEARRLQEQHSLGRPFPSERLCGNDNCSLRCCCVYKTRGVHFPWYILNDREESEDGVLVKNILTEFAYLVTTELWPAMEKQSDVLLKARSIEAFVSSPPVRAAYLDYRTVCQKNDFDFSTESRLREALANTMPMFRDLITALNAAAEQDGQRTETLIHRHLQPPQRSGQTTSPQWTQESCIMRFLLTAELWRRHGERHMRQRNWAWEEPWTVAELLSAVLLNYWLMDGEKCFAREPTRSSEQCDEAWQDWLDKYPLLDDSSDDEDESLDLVPKPFGVIRGLDLERDIGYVGGVGTAARGPFWRD
ncbi:hypothetical protein ACQKWADRAFT_323253 [Trichoderma austrokoningii]